MEIKNRNRKIVANIIFFVIVIVVVAVVVFHLNDIEELMSVTKNTKIEFIILAIVFLLIYMFCTNFSMYLIQKELPNNLGFLTSMNISNTEYLFNAITPFSSGGQPFQAYFLMKNGLTGDESASVLVANFTIYQFVLTIFSTTGLILYYSSIKSTIDQYAIVITIGYFINTLILVGLILVSTIDGVKKLLKGFFNLLGKIKFLSNFMEKTSNKTFEFVESFQEGTKYLLSNKKVLLGSTFFRILSLFVLNSIPVLVFLALGVNIKANDYLFIIMMSAFASTFMMWVPTPGATGGVEWAFTMLFTGVIATSSVVVTTMLFWRIITYFIPLLLGFVSYLFVKKKGRLDENRNI